MCMWPLYWFWVVAPVNFVQLLCMTPDNYFKCDEARRSERPKPAVLDPEIFAYAFCGKRLAVRLHIESANTVKQTLPL
jgi:hypothetical protein